MLQSIRIKPQAQPNRMAATATPAIQFFSAGLTELRCFGNEGQNPIGGIFGRQSRAVDANLRRLGRFVRRIDSGEIGQQSGAGAPVKPLAR